MYPKIRKRLNDSSIIYVKGKQSTVKVHTHTAPYPPLAFDLVTGLWSRTSQPGPRTGPSTRKKILSSNKSHIGESTDQNLVYMIIWYKHSQFRLLWIWV